jgi:hypothetical protein
VTFTSEAAINELLAGLGDFRGTGGWTWQSYRKLDKDVERSQAAQPKPSCPVCGSEEYWGLSDVDPFLDRDGVNKWACFHCPGGCSEIIRLSLSKNERPKWTTVPGWLKRPAVSPSVRQLNDCRCHFWIKQGRVD